LGGHFRIEEFFKRRLKFAFDDTVIGRRREQGIHTSLPLAEFNLIDKNENKNGGID